MCSSNTKLVLTANLVWILILATMPIFVLIMGFADYIYYGEIAWWALSGSVLRIAAVDQIKRFGRDKVAYQKVFLSFLTLSFYVLQATYCGLLISEITKPNLNRLIDVTGDLLKQDELGWVMEDGIGLIELIEAEPAGSTMRQILDKVTFLNEIKDWYGESGCHSVSTKNSYKLASICEWNSIRDIIDWDYDDTSTCNFYQAQDIIYTVPQVMFFQVG